MRLEIENKKKKQKLEEEKQKIEIEEKEKISIIDTNEKEKIRIYIKGLLDEYNLAKKYNIEAKIIDNLYNIIYNNKDIKTILD